MTLRTSSPPGMLLVLALMAASAHADSDSRVPLLPAYVQECGSCHVAFAPGLLPAASWQRLMADLGRHFGSDASLDAAVPASPQVDASDASLRALPDVAEAALLSTCNRTELYAVAEDGDVLSSWLATHAGSGKRAASVPRDDRITQGSWFVNEHRDVRHVIGSAQVKSASDCAACHTRAADGSYREREIRIPK